MKKNKNLLGIIGTSLVLAGCCNYMDYTKNERDIVLKERNKLIEHYTEANPGQITGDEMRFMEKYEPLNATSQETLMITLLYHNVGSPLETYKSELTTEQRWNSLDVEKKLAFYHRLKEIYFPK